MRRQVHAGRSRKSKKRASGKRSFIKSEARDGRAKPPKMKLSAIGEAIRRAAARGI